jgi:hypothetical protein
VVGVEDEQDLECPLERRLGVVPGLGHPEHHRKEVRGEPEPVVGIDVGQAGA